MRAFIVAAVLALAGGGAVGCVTSSTVTDGDRQVVDQVRKANMAAAEDIAKARAAVPEGSESWTMMGLGMRKLADVELGTAHLQQVHGLPKESKTYTEAQMQAAIKQSKEEHQSSTFTQILLGVGGVAAGLAGAWFGMPWLAGIFPKLTGKVGELAKTGVEIITATRKKAEENGGMIHIRDVLKIAKEYNVSAGVDVLAKKTATAFEEKLGFAPLIKLDEPKTEVAPAAPAS
jgi:hypothetical protein